MITTEMKAKVHSRIDECMQIIKAKYKVDLPQPTIRFDLRGTTAGTANYSKWVIQINPVLLKNNFEDMIYETVPHELAHLATHIIYPEAHKRTWATKRRPHGAEWQSIMRAMGVEPKRTHNYDTVEIKLNNMKAGSILLQCTTCGNKYTLGAKRAVRFRANPTGIWCKCSPRQPLQVVDATTAKQITAPKPTPVAKVVTPTKVVNTKSGASKLDRCIELYKANKTLSRSEVIKLFVSVAQCTPAGASTYYATCKSRVG